MTHFVDKQTSAGYTYDANGNLTNDGHNTLVYDGENRLVSDTDGSGTATYVYNALGQRAINTFGATTRKYIYDGNRPIIEYRTDSPGSEYIDKEYVYLGNQVLVELSGGPFYYLQDRTSVRATVDANGNLLGQLAAYPFGENWYVNNTSTERQFTSYLRDYESGNDYAINREYVNRLARFSSLDMGQPSSTDPQQFNRYSYVANDPVNRTDSTGRLFDPIANCDPDFDPTCNCDPFFDEFCSGDGGGGGGGMCGDFPCEGGGEPLPPPPPPPVSSILWKCFLAQPPFLPPIQGVGCSYLCVSLSVPEGLIGVGILFPNPNFRGCFLAPCPFWITVSAPPGEITFSTGVASAFPPICH